MLTNPQDLQNQANRDFRDLAGEEFDTRTLLRNAAEQAVVRKYEDFLIVDTDSHHYETEAFKEIAEYIDDPVMRYEAKFQGHSRGGFTSEDSESLLRGFLSPQLFERGLICRADDRGDPVIQISPPLVAGTAEIDEIAGTLREVLVEAQERLHVGAPRSDSAAVRQGT